MRARCPKGAPAGSTGPAEAEEPERQREEAGALRWSWRAALDGQAGGPTLAQQKRAKGTVGSSLREERPRAGARRQECGARGPPRDDRLECRQRIETGRQLPKLLGPRHAQRQSEEREPTAVETSNRLRGHQARESGERRPGRRRPGQKEEGPGTPGLG